MTTDITELEQRTDLLMDNALETAKQLRELSESPVAEAIFESIVENENGKEIQFERTISDLAYAAFLQLERLVEALEKAQREAAVDWGAAASLNVENQELKRRIAELEESNAQVIQSRDHYKRMTEEGLKQLAESRTVTVKLPDYRHERFWDSRCEEFNPVEYLAACIEMWREEITAAGIKWEAE